MDFDRMMEMVTRADPSVGIGGEDGVPHEFMAKFMECVVRECAEVAFSQWCDNGHEESARPTLLRHFGLS